MNKRDFIKAGLLSVVGISTTNLRASNIIQMGNNKFPIPELPYSISDFNTVFSTDALRIHITEHLNGYNKSLNKQIDQVVFKPKNLRGILENTEQYNQSIINNACGYYNHRMFFKLINPNNHNISKLNVLDAINKTFGSEKKFKMAFAKKAKEFNANGWLWLVLKDNNLKIVGTENNDNPLLNSLDSNLKGFPVFGIDMWEHAYKPDYGNNKQAYINKILNGINWSFVEKRFKRAGKYKIA